MPSKEITVKLKLDAETPHRLKDKESLLKKISDLDAEDQQRLFELASSPKALEGLKNNWELLKNMFS